MRNAQRHTTAGLAVVITSLLGLVLSAQESPRDLFERARLLEDSSQDLSDAVRLYGQVVEQGVCKISVCFEFHRILCGLRRPSCVAHGKSGRLSQGSGRVAHAGI